MARRVIGTLMLFGGSWGVVSSVLYLYGDLSQAMAEEILLAHVWAWISGTIAALGVISLLVAFLQWLESDATTFRYLSTELLTAFRPTSLISASQKAPYRRS